MPLALGHWLRMKPKKRQPLDFSALPVESPIEDTARAPEVDPDAPISEPDLDLDIAAVPRSDEMSLRGPLAADPEPPRASGRRSLFQRPPERAEVAPEPTSVSAPVPPPVDTAPPAPSEPARPPEPERAEPFAKPDPEPRRGRFVAPDPGPPPSFLTPSAAQSPAPTLESEPPARLESTSATLRDPPIQTLSPPQVIERKPMPAPLYWTLAVSAAGLWALAPIAFALGYGAGVPALRVDQFALLVFAAMAVGPAIFTLLAAYMLRQAIGISAELRHTRALTDRLVTPTALAAAGASGAVDAIRGEIDAAALAATSARERMLALRDALADETRRLTDAAAETAGMARQLAEGLGHERSAMQALSSTLDAQSTAVVDAIGSQARMVAEASDLAETQLREAEASLAARAADLAAAAAEASDAARIGAEDLSRQIARLETAGQGVGDQMGAVEKNLAQQRAALVAASQALRSEQEDFASESETRTAQLTEFVAYTRTGATELGDMAAMGAEILRGLIIAAADQLREIGETARLEREALAAETSSAIAALASAAGGQRDEIETALHRAMEALAASAHKAGEGVEQRAEAARSRVDQLNEIAFAVGQKADTVFESRMDEARDLIEQSAQVVEQAGARTAQKLAESLQVARATIAEMEAMLAEVSQRTASMPAEALERTEQLQAQIERGVEDLRASARRTAEETAAIDQAFQERVRRNYDMLSEAVAMMGMSAASAPALAAQASRPATPVARPPRAAAPPPPVAPPEPLPVEPYAPTEEAGSRPRLRLTPTASDEEFRTIFDAAGGRPAAPAAEAAEPAAGAWSWRSLLSSMENSSPGDAALGEKLASEILAMGIDPTALLPRGRIDEIAAAIQTHDAAGAREVVKKLAPAAIRRLVRRLFSDATLRANAERFLRRHAAMIEEASAQDREGFLVAALLSSEAGRAYLLLDAASGDLA